MNAFFVILTAIILLFSPINVFGQNNPPDAILSWSANTLTPHGYKGGGNPSPGSLVRASIDVFQNGRPVALGPYVVQWRINGSVAGGGKGRSSFSFVFSDLPAPIQTKIDVRVLGYPGGDIFKNTTIESVTPKMAIIPQGKTENDALVFRAVPFFFNVSSFLDMVFSWQIQNEPVESTENPHILRLFPGTQNMASEFLISVQGLVPGNNKNKTSKSFLFSNQ